MSLLKLFPSKYYRVNITGQLQLGEFLMNGKSNPLSNVADAPRRGNGKLSWLMRCFESGNFAWKQRVSGELSAQPVEHLQGARIVLIAHERNCQKNARERSQVVSTLRCKLQVGDTRLLVPRQT